MGVIEIIEEKLSMFKNLYYRIRIVDPIRKEVISNEEGKTKVIECNCYELLRKDGYCKNCISMRAFLENDTFLKIEFADGKPVLITASPVTIHNETYIVEMIKNISQVASSVNSEKSTYNIEGLLKEINDVAIKDELTGIYNRRYINERLTIDINDSMFYNQPLCVIMADLDFFKVVNDTYGHVVGDWVLKDFAKILSTSIRNNSDWVGRYGGEEFLIVLRNTDANNGFKVAEKIRKLVEDKVFAYKDIEIKITASFGAYSIINTKEMKLTVDELVNNADKNLYLAKNSGRNKTVVNSATHVASGKF
ncbi:GGDEF domain-containing protein [Clostridium sp. CS001]|uniref:GGDEF domain-containing protein n=1 Tax=Clostridium sp. CS001 TaxID=2880648 RepID=UPI001CF4E7B2|nr:GGDEF domain-containing protein [Clostridium sp. CS001]MCB2290023.1 GGDEF domain-containing protein [Clostridium sp. CS001]